MKVIASPTILDAFEWDGSEETFERIKELAEDFDDKVYMRDGQLVVYNATYKEEEIVELGHYIVLENNRLEVNSPITFDVLYHEVKEE